MAKTYHSQQNIINTERVRALLTELPPYCTDFMRGIENNTLVRTRLAYATDLRTFFRFLLHEGIVPLDDMRSITTSHLDALTLSDFEAYSSYLSAYKEEDDDITHTNEARAKSRKLASIRALYRYLQMHERIKNNPTSLISMPTIRKKEKIHLEPDEVARLLDMVESGDGLSSRQQKFHQKTSTRDLAILTLFLGTGIRISELVGLDMDDINFITDEFTVVRKGGKEDVLSFGQEVRTALLAYMLEREKISASNEEDEKALFLSLRRQRMTVRTVEMLVKKYAQVAVPNKKISPHKFRSTYGTTLYKETGDIYLVAEVLGHEDVSTTTKHYADMSSERKRLAAKAVKLRDD